MEGISTFEHDADARHDPKFVSIMKGRGAVAYAWVFMLWEYLYQNNGSIPVDMFFEAIVRDQCKIPESIDVGKFIDAAVEVKLFYYDKKGDKSTLLRSSGIDRRLGEIKNRSVIYAKNSTARWTAKAAEMGVTLKVIEEIYEAFPKKVDPEKSKTYIRRDLISGKVKPFEMLSRVKTFSAAVIKYKNTEQWQYVPGSSPWFRREGWREDIPSWTKKGIAAGRAASGEDYERGKK